MVSDILKTQALIYQDAAEEHKRTSARMKFYYDRSRRPHRIIPGSICYLKTPTVQGEHGTKFTPYYSEPMIYVEVLPRDKVTLRDLQTNKMYKNPVHVSRLKLANRYNPHLAYRDF